MYHKYQKQSQSGQAIILIAMCMVILLAATGLAIDGGGLFLLYRDAQNATDAAALNAAFALCTGGDVEHAGLSAASLNGFTNNDTDTFVEVHNPPLDGQHIGDASYLQIIIQAEKPSYFIHLVYKEALTIEAQTEAHCESGQTLPAPVTTLNHALFAGSTECQNALSASGSSQNIFGNVHSNRDQKWSGSSSNLYGDLTTVTTLDGNTGNLTVNAPGTITQGASYSPMPYLYDTNVFTLNGTAQSVANRNGDTYFYFGGCSTPNSAMDKNSLAAHIDANGRLADGIYYSPCGIKINWDMSAGAEAANVTLVAEGEIQFSGNNHNLTPYYDGLLLFSDLDRNPSGNAGNQCSQDVIGISGSQIQWRGFIYAPNGHLSMSGAFNRGYGGLIADSITLSGSSIEIHFDTSFIPAPVQLDPTISIIR